MDWDRACRPHDAATDRPLARRDDAPPRLVDASMLDRLRGGLDLLLRAYAYAGDVESDPWDFALEIEDLRAAGLSRSDLRWLLKKGLARHARDVSLPGEGQRAFHPCPGDGFTRRSCFVLTAAGAEYLEYWAAAEPSASELGEAGAPAPHAESVQRAAAELAIPRWDRDLQELSFDGRLIKQFKVPAPNQEMVLAAFEEEGWPPRIDDPLPPQIDLDPKRRLHDTIVSLNRNHKSAALRFLGDGSGTGVRWTRLGG